MHNIQVVDEIVRQTESLFEDYFGDNKTAFVFTADHGMSNIGNHGDGRAETSSILTSLTASDDLDAFQIQITLVHL